MTELKKPVRRTTELLLDNRIQARDRDRIIVTLYPDLTIGFKQYKRRREYHLPLAVCYKLAILEHGKEERRRKALERKIKKGKF